MQNMYKLVISEKPSVGKSIAAVLGANERKDGYFIGSGYIVSWCFGHLAELAEAAAYDEKYAKWRYNDLPILPESWQYSVARDKAKQLALLNTLMHRENVSEVVNACDAGREGESIFRTVYLLNKCDKPMKRLWISSMEDTAIRKGFETLKDGSAYDNLYASALCRSKADWLVGINATRLFSVLYHRTLNVGRVVSPTLALIVQREAEIDAFKPEPFYTVTLGLPGFDAGSERMKNKPEAESLQKACGSQMAVVKAVERKDKAEKPPALYDLTTLQRDANRILGFTAQQTLDYLQLLYEKKLCTYPRTDSQYLTSDMADGLPALVSNVAAAMPKVEGVPIRVNATQIINDKKVSDHHAVIPTANFKEAALTGLPAGERAVLELVALRLLCAVSQPHEYTETAVTLECAGHSFSAKGRTVMNPGWRALMEAHYSGKGENETSDAAKALPPVDEGQTFTVHSAAVKEGKTTPPKHYTEDTLLSAMEVAGAKEMPEDAERKGLGTPATRAAILEKLSDMIKGETNWTDGLKKRLCYFEFRIEQNEKDGGHLPDTYTEPNKFTPDQIGNLYQFYNVSLYKGGKSYYKFWIRHNDNGNDGMMGVMEFCIVRNNVYQLYVTGVRGLGDPLPYTPGKDTPDKPDETDDVTIDVTIYVKDWVKRTNKDIII